MNNDLRHAHIARHSHLKMG